MDNETVDLLPQSSHHEASSPAAMSVTPLASQSLFVPESHSPAQHQGLIDRALKYGGIGSTTIALTPYLLKHAGIGTEQFEFFAKNCCPVIQQGGPSWTVTKYGEPTYGIAGAVASTLEKLPVVGDDLSRGGIKNALTAGGLILLGHYGGHGLANQAHEPDSMLARLGRGFGNIAQLMGLVVALPAVLPAVGHGVALLSSVIGLDAIDAPNRNASGPATELMRLLGKAPGECKQEMKLTDGAYAGLGMLCCLVPGILSSLPAIFTSGLAGLGNGQAPQHRGETEGTMAR